MLAEGLEKAGHDAAHVRDYDMQAADDEQRLNVFEALGIDSGNEPSGVQSLFGALPNAHTAPARKSARDPLAPNSPLDT